MKLPGYIYSALAVLIVISCAGCIFTETVVITASVIPNDNVDNLPLSEVEGASTEKLRVDFRENATFKDYQDDIKNIESIGFFISARNQLFSDATFQLFFEEDTTRNYTSAQGLVDSLAPLVLTDLVLPRRSQTSITQVVVDWNESIQYVDNLEQFKDAIATGVFDLYPTAFPRDNFNIIVDSLVVIVTLTGSK